MKNFYSELLRLLMTSCIKRRVKQMLLVSLFTTAIGFSAQAKYTLTDADVEVTNGVITSCSYDFADKDIVIPSTLDGQSVTGIADGNYAYGIFSNKALTSVELPQSLKTIGTRAFQKNSLSSVSLPSSLTSIGGYAFYENSITTLTLPSTLTYLGASAFGWNTGLGKVTMPTPTDCSNWFVSDGTKIAAGSSITLSTYYSYTAIVYHTLTDDEVTVVNGVLETCSYDFAAKFVIIPSVLDQQTVIGIKGSPDAVTEAIKGPFESKGLMEITIPASVKYIGMNSFYDNNLYSVVFEQGSKLMLIEGYAFNRNSSLNMTLPTTDVPGFVEWVRSDRTVYAGNVVGNPESYAFYAKVPYTLTDNDVVVESGIITSCSYDFLSKFITIPDQLDNQSVIGIKELSKNGIFTGYSIMELTLPTTLQSLCFCAFNNNSLASIDLSRCTGLKKIGNYAFYRNALQSLEVPASVEYIGYNAFSTNKLTQVSFATNTHISYIGSQAFNYNYSANNTLLEMTLPTPLKSGFTFTNWEDDSYVKINGGSKLPDFTAEYTAKFSLVSSVESAKGSMLVVVSPNPVQNQLTISANELASIQIATLAGNVVKTQIANGNSVEIDVRDLANGIYLVKATNQNGDVTVQKVIKK